MVLGPNADPKWSLRFPRDFSFLRRCWAGTALGERGEGGAVWHLHYNDATRRRYRRQANGLRTTLNWGPFLPSWLHSEPGFGALIMSSKLCFGLFWLISWVFCSYFFRFFYPTFRQCLCRNTCRGIVSNYYFLCHFIWLGERALHKMINSSTLCNRFPK